MRDLTINLLRLMRNAGYRQRESGVFETPEGKFVCFPPGTIRRQLNGNIHQVSLKLACGSWAQFDRWIESDLLKRQREQIAICRDNPPQDDGSALWKQMQPVVQLVGTNATQLLES